MQSIVPRWRSPHAPATVPRRARRQPAAAAVAARARSADHTDEELRAAEDAAILDAIRFQEDVGLQSITDGEFRREKYFTHFAQAVDGFGRAEGTVTFHDDSGRPMVYETDVIAGKLSRARGIATDEYAFVHEHTSRTPKATLPSPGAQHHFRFKPGVSDVAYPDLEELFEDLARIYREELADSPRWARPTCSSTTSRSRSCAIRSTAPRCRPAAPIRTRSSRATCSSRTTRWPAGPTR